MKLVLKFLKETKLYRKKITPSKVVEILKSQGFEVIEFITAEDTIIKHFGLSEYMSLPPDSFE